MNNETPNGEYKINRPIEIKCTECGKISMPDFQLEKNENGDYLYSDGCLTLCDECMNKGWTSNPEEVSKAILEDPLLSKVVSHQSPYFQK